MDPELVEEWAALRSRAISKLKTGPGLLRGRRLAAKVLVESAFDDAASYEVHEWTKGGTGYIAVRTVWRMTADVSKFESVVARLRFARELEPTMDRREITPDQSRLKRLLDHLADSSVPLQSQSRLVQVDGTRHILTLGDAFNGCELTWGTSVPVGWEAAQEFVDAIKDLVDAAVESAG